MCSRDPFTARELLDSLIAFDGLLAHRQCRACLARAIAAAFEIIPSSAAAHEADVLFTGYYQPVIDGSLTPGDGFDYPIYGVPADLLVPEQVGANGAENDDKHARQYRV